MQVYYKLVSPQESEKALPAMNVQEEKKSLYQTLIWVIIGLGILLRLYHYFDNRSLWVDEIYLSTSIIKMSYLELATSSLDYQQKAPILLLWLVRLCVDLFGMSEMSLRLIPLLGGLGSLFLFVPIARRFLTPFGIILALSLVAIAPPIVYHAVEIKQYSTDLFAAVVSIYLYIRYHDSLNYSSLLMWGFWGALLLWFSFPAIFVLAGIAIGCSLYYLFTKNWKAFFRSIIPFSMWLVSFATNFLLFTYKHTDSDWLVNWFRNRQGFMPADGSLLDGSIWVMQALYRLLDYPMGVLWNAESLAGIDNTLLRILPKMALFLLAFAAVGFYYFYKRDRKLLLVITMPVVLTLVASLLDQYPFYERLVVFLAPFPILLVAQGCARLTNRFSAKGKWSYLFPLIMLGWPLWSSAKQAINTDYFWGYKKSYYRDALLYIREHFQEGDVLYVYWNAKPAFRFYNTTYDLQLEAHELTDARFLVANEEEYVKRLRAEYGNTEGVGRIWFLYEPYLMLEIGDYDHTPPWYHFEGIKGGAIIRQDLLKLGKEVDHYTGSNVGVSLFEIQAKK